MTKFTITKMPTNSLKPRIRPGNIVKVIDVNKFVETLKSLNHEIIQNDKFRYFQCTGSYKTFEVSSEQGKSLEVDFCQNTPNLFNLACYYGLIKSGVYFLEG